jgi:hypothetical protein
MYVRTADGELQNPPVPKDVMARLARMEVEVRTELAGLTAWPVSLYRLVVTVICPIVMISLIALPSIASSSAVSNGV